MVTIVTAIALFRYQISRAAILKLTFSYILNLIFLPNISILRVVSYTVIHNFHCRSISLFQAFRFIWIVTHVNRRTCFKQNKNNKERQQKLIRLVSKRLLLLYIFSLQIGFWEKNIIFDENARVKRPWTLCSEWRKALVIWNDLNQRGWCKWRTVNKQSRQ